MDQAPDPAVREMVKYMDEQGVENCFDRFDKQKPHCTFGLAGVCCRICSLGPCKITERSPRGTCGANADLIVVRNLVRAAVGGVAAHGARAREVMLTIKKAATGAVDLPILGKDVARKMAVATPERRQTWKKLAYCLSAPIMRASRRCTRPRSAPRATGARPWIRSCGWASRFP